MYKFLSIVLVFFSLTIFGAERLVVGIAGGTGSGKTTLANKISEMFKGNAVVISQDSYYRDLSALSFDERGKQNFDHPNSIEFSLLRTHIQTLKEGKSIQKPIYNFRTHARESEIETVQPNQIIVVEGILLLTDPELRDLFDVKIFIDTADDIRLLRRIERDIHERGRSLTTVRQQYMSTVKPMHDKFVAPSKQYADLVIPHGGENETALNFITSHLKDHVKK